MLGISLNSENFKCIGDPICSCLLKVYFITINARILINTNGNFYQTSQHMGHSFTNHTLRTV